MFGGIVPAAKALGTTLVGLINPYTLTAAAVAGLGAAYYQGSKEADAFNAAIIKTGDYAGLSASAMQDLARYMDDIQGVTQASASKAIAAVANTGQFAGRQLETVAEAALKWQAATGTAVDEMVAKFVKLADDPVKALLSLNESEHFLTEQTLQAVKSLETQGKTTEAATLAIETYAKTLSDRSDQMKANLGYLERAWAGVKGAAAEAWDAMLGVGRKATGQEYLEWIARLKKQLTQDMPIDMRKAMERELAKAEANFKSWQAKNVHVQLIDGSIVDSRKEEAPTKTKDAKRPGGSKTNTDDNSAQSLIASIQRQIEANNQLAATGEKVSTSDRMVIQAKQLLADKTNTMTAATRKLLESMIPQLQ